MKRRFVLLLFLILLLLSGCGYKLTCPDDYNLKGNTCEKIDKIAGTVSREYYCVVGYLINGNCYYTNNMNPIYPSYGYYCGYGYTLSGNKCYPTPYPAMFKDVTICPSGYTDNPSGIDSGLDVPYLEAPSLVDFCYKRITTEPKKKFVLFD